MPPEVASECLSNELPTQPDRTSGASSYRKPRRFWPRRTTDLAQRRRVFHMAREIARDCGVDLEVASVEERDEFLEAGNVALQIELLRAKVIAGKPISTRGHDVMVRLSSE